MNSKDSNVRLCLFSSNVNRIVNSLSSSGSKFYFMKKNKSEISCRNNTLGILLAKQIFHVYHQKQSLFLRNKAATQFKFGNKVGQEKILI